MSTEIETLKSDMMSVAHKLHTKAELSELEKKQAAWFKYGTLLYNKDMEWSALSDKTIESLKKVAPLKIEDVPGAEKSLQECRSVFRSIEEQRLEITKLQDTAKEKIMLHEKAGKHEIERLTNDIIRIKSKHEAEQDQQRKKEQERQHIILTLKNSAIEQAAEFRSNISSELNELYKLALSQDIKPDDIESWIAAYKAELQVKNLAQPALTYNYHSQEEVMEIIREYYICDHTMFIKEWNEGVKKKFSDYAVAYLNKDAAIERNDLDAQKEQAEIQVSKTHAQLAAQIDFVSSSLETQVLVKELKRSYKVDMTDSWETNAVVAAAFYASFARINPWLENVGKPGSFTHNQMKNYLGKLKTEDNKFSATGIKFVEETKL